MNPLTNTTQVSAETSLQLVSENVHRITRSAVKPIYSPNELVNGWKKHLSLLEVKIRCNLHYYLHGKSPEIKAHFHALFLKEIEIRREIFLGSVTQLLNGKLCPDNFIAKCGIYISLLQDICFQGPKGRQAGDVGAIDYIVANGRQRLTQYEYRQDKSFVVALILEEILACLEGSTSAEQFEARWMIARDDFSGSTTTPTQILSRMRIMVDRLINREGQKELAAHFARIELDQLFDSIAELHYHDLQLPILQAEWQLIRQLVSPWPSSYTFQAEWLDKVLM